MTDELAGVYLELPHRPATNYYTISNSEMQAWMACQYKHYFSYGLGLQSRNHDEELLHGILGHAVLAAYYKARQMGEDHRTAIFEAMEIYHNTKDVPQVVKMQSMKRLLEYFDYYANDEFEVVAVEERYIVEIGASNYGFTLDLLFRTPKGQLVLRDHKFVGKFWNDEKPKYEPQPFKYIYGLRRRGLKVDKAEYNFIKYVDASNGEHFRRSPIYLNDRKIEGVMKEHVKIADQILDRRKLPIAQWKQTAIRNLSWACQYCPFRLPCEMELEGRDISRVLRVDFQPSDYGYHD